MVRPNRSIIFLFAALALIVLVLPVAAQDDAVSDDEVNEVARDVYCPVCENTPLDVCQTKACADWRELIRTKLAAGESKEDIFDYFARQYGDGVLADPPSRGVSLVMLWVMPVVLILLGLLFFARYLRGLRSAETQAAAPAAYDMEPAVPSEAPESTQDDYLTRVEEELNKSNE
mgnify:FL=1